MESTLRNDKERQVSQHTLKCIYSYACYVYICDRASKKGPSGHKLHIIIKTLVFWVLYNIFILCKL